MLAPHAAPPETKEKSAAAIEALERMGKALDSHRSLAFEATLITEAVLANGQKVLISGKSSLEFRRPDKLRLELKTDSSNRHLFHDGEKLTLVVPEKGYAGELEMKTDTHTAMAIIAREYGLEFPLMELLVWGTKDADGHQIEEAFLVGNTEIDGKEVQHWAIRGPGLDWEIWLAEGEHALPLRISTVNRKDPHAPRFFADLHWQHADSLPISRFRPRLPDDVQWIPFEKLRPKAVKGD
ncbi:DUF2092 domain-containing protein [Microbulbifer sp. SA54]|uniref:DUF2092 domain-containing protein n=1 Tax=Microbulbifer sp. SA54 TaxID=3401577 RepID=UPI003AAB6D98